MISLPEELHFDAGQLARAALQTQGLRALENPLSAAVVHEAGHAVLYAVHGYAVERVKVWRKKRGFARGQWLGFTTVHNEIICGPDTSVDDDFKYATILLAGVLAEQIFDTANFRMGSSLDEVAVVRGLASNIVLKTGAEFTDVMVRVVAVTGKTLRHNEAVVREIASELQHHKIIGRRRLASFLAPVRTFAGG